MKKTLIFCFVFISIFCSAVDALYAQVSKGEFDFYVLALSWQPAFCETKAEKHLPECECQNEKSFSSKNFTLHGLWPSVESDASHDYSYCGVSSSLVALDKKHKWEELPSDFISKSTLSELLEYMPGARSDLFKHEWYKHGVCTGMSGDDYFLLMLQLVKEFAKSKSNMFIASNVGKSIAKKTLYKRFESEFGKGSASALQLVCTKVNGVQLLTEIRINLKKNLSLSSKLKDVLDFTKPSKDNCPAEFKIDRFGIGNYNN